MYKGTCSYCTAVDCWRTLRGTAEREIVLSFDELKRGKVGRKVFTLRTRLTKTKKKAIALLYRPPIEAHN